MSPTAGSALARIALTQPQKEMRGGDCHLRNQQSPSSPHATTESGTGAKGLCLGSALWGGALALALAAGRVSSLLCQHISLLPLCLTREWDPSARDGLGAFHLPKQPVHIQTDEP